MDCGPRYGPSQIAALPKPFRPQYNQNMTPGFQRICLIVLDSAGIGEMPDAADWGDAGADTLGHILESRKVDLPNLQ